MGDYATDSEGKVTGWQLSTGQQVNLGFSAFGDFLGFFSALGQSKGQSFSMEMQAWQASVNSQSLALDAQDIIRVGREQENKMREEGLRMRGEQRVAMGASGFDVASKSYQNILSETDRQIENNANIIRESTMSAYANKKYQERMQEIQSDLYKSSAKIAEKQGKNYGYLVSAGMKAATLSYFGG